MKVLLLVKAVMQDLMLQPLVCLSVPCVKQANLNLNQDKLLVMIVVLVLILLLWVLLHVRTVLLVISLQVVVYLNVLCVQQVKVLPVEPLPVSVVFLANSLLNQ
jgi:hypothetical protein